MYIDCPELQSEIKESLLHGLLNWICDLANTRKIIVVPGLYHLVPDVKLPEFITVKRMYTEYKIYTDFPVEMLGLTPDEPIFLSVCSLLDFRWNEGEYEGVSGQGHISVWFFNKPKKKSSSKK